VRRQATFRVLLFGLVTVLAAEWACAQMSLTPRVVQVDLLTCQQLLSLSAEQRDRVLIYLNGYLDGERHATIWDERLAGERIDRALADCKSKPEKFVLRAFTEAWSR